MQIFKLTLKNKHTILALGAESAGNFSIYLSSLYPSPLIKEEVKEGSSIYFSENFGDLLKDVNFNEYKHALIKFLKKNKIKPDIILTDLHPLYKTTLLGQELAKKYKAKYIQVQHHLAHIFSAIGENALNPKSEIRNPKHLAYRQAGIQNRIGIALDGTGYGMDEKIWGGEIFMLSTFPKVKPSELRRFHLREMRTIRIGHLENQTMIGGDLAVKEPARMLISILAKFLPKEKIYTTLNQSFCDDRHKMIGSSKKSFYTRNQFEVLYNQMRNGFNCQKTSSTGRVLDAVSILLGFCKNERNFKHEPTILLEQNSTIPYNNLKPKIKKNISLPPLEKGSACPIDRGWGKFGKPSIIYQLDTTYLFKYLFKYLRKDKKRLAATAQLYIAEGLYEIIKKSSVCLDESRLVIDHQSAKIFLAGGISNNKIISKYLISKGAIINEIIPRGDAGISFGQIMFFLI